MYEYDQFTVTYKEEGDVEFGNLQKSKAFWMKRKNLPGVSAIAHLESYQEDGKVSHKISAVYNAHNEYKDDLRGYLEGIVYWSKDAQLV